MKVGDAFDRSAMNRTSVFFCPVCGSSAAEPTVILSRVDYLCGFAELYKGYDPNNNFWNYIVAAECGSPLVVESLTVLEII